MSLKYFKTFDTHSCFQFKRASYSRLLFHLIIYLGCIYVRLANTKFLESTPGAPERKRYNYGTRSKWNILLTCLFPRRCLMNYFFKPSFMFYCVSLRTHDRNVPRFVFPPNKVYKEYLQRYLEMNSFSSLVWTVSRSN